MSYETEADFRYVLGGDTRRINVSYETTGRYLIVVMVVVEL
jgi:hypothetical protein